jgi:hypothetical protein
MITAGFAATDPPYLMAQALLGQSPKVQQFKIGRLQAHVHAVELTITADTGTIAISITKDGVTREYTQTGGGGGIPAEATALALQMNNDASGWGSSGSAELTIAASVNDVTIDAVSPANDGEIWYYGDWSNIQVLDVTLDPGIATDLAAIVLEDDDFYGVAIDVNSEPIGDALATWTETQRKICALQSQDSIIPTSDITDLAQEIFDDSRIRTWLFYTHKNSLAEYPACGQLGKGLPKDPGSQTWAYKTISGVSPSVLTSTEIGYLKTKNATHYITIAGVNVTRFGEMASGEWIDRTRLSDWVQARIEEAIFALLVGNDKLPYTDDTVDLVDAAIYSVYKQGAENGGFILSDYHFEAPAAADQDSADRLARLMKDITFSGTFSDAVHKFEIEGVIS